jgi:uroporphyrinogen-III decarboxylase
MANHRRADKEGQMNTSVVLKKALVSEEGLHVGRPDLYERYSAALFGRPDRTPVVVQPGLYAMALHGLSSRRFFREPETFIHASHNTAAYFGFDWWSPVFDAFNIEAEALGQTLVWREGMEPWVDMNDPLLRERADLDWLRPPNPGESGRMPFVIAAYRRFAEITGVPPVCVCCSPLTLAALLRGIRSLIVDMYREPGWVDRLLAFLSQEIVVPWIRTLAESTGASTVVMCDPMAGPPTLSPALMRRFWQPHVSAVIEATSSPSCTVLDSAGSCEGQVADASLVTEVKTLEIQPERWRDGPRERIVDAVCQVLEEERQDGRFALLLHHIPADAPIEHVRTAVEAVKQFGRYPIPARLDQQTFRSPETIPFQQWVRQHGLVI